MSYVQTVSVRLSVTLSYTPKLHISSARGISYGASGKAALGGREQGAAKWDITEKNEEFKLLRC